ncbi:MAG: GGDEF domain-containing protein [Deltaproteobacteria bacterium]|nr:GGDEF domain-containing protein [Deltaproteobacteria bacterium]
MFSHGICPQCAHEHYPEIFPTAPDAPPATPALDPPEEEQEVLRRLDSLRQAHAHQDHPLMAELEDLARRHGRLLRRLEKITRISDGFQRQLKELNATLREASRIDPLTGLSNRRDMMDRLAAELGRVARTGAPAAVLMIDVDHFKAVNDVHGHEVGDLVLQALGASLAESIRVYDSCGRWGGEEFLVLLPETDRDAAVAVAEKIRSEAARGVPAPCSTLTVSVGVAVHAADEPLRSLLRRADEAMYEAKHLGRNRVEVAPDPV